jgi:transketolase
VEENRLKIKADQLREKVIDLCIGAQSGHLASCLSCTEIMTALYYDVLSREDKFFLSKGHAAAMMYCIMHDLGKMSDSMLGKFGTEELYIHPKIGYPGAEISSGSLGHGLGIASGMAYGFKRSCCKGTFYVLMGDAECYEGSVWESAMFAGHHRLNNLVAIIDRNHKSTTGFIEDILDLEPLDEKFKAFRWDTENVDGHDVAQITRALKGSQSRKSGAPFAIIAETIKGKGIKELEDDPLCHIRMPKKKNRP